MKRFAWWGNIIVLSVLTLVLAGPIWADGMPSGPHIFTDYGSYLGEYQAAGALQFYDNTEAILRLAQFERALMRYRFLKGQIQRKMDYRGLLAMVDLRLNFLKKQMHLTNWDIAPIPPRKVWIPPPKKPVAKEASKKDKAAKPKSPGATANQNNTKVRRSVPGQLPPLMVIPRTLPRAGTPPPKAAVAPVTAAPAAAAAPPAAAAASPAATAQKPAEVVTADTPKAEEDKEETKPAPPLSFWDRLKLRLHLKK